MMLLILQTPIAFDVMVEMRALNCKLISVSRTKWTVSGVCMVTAPTGAIHHYYLEEKVMEEWQGEISIEKYLKEILEILKQLNKDMAELRHDAEYRFDGYREAIKNKNDEE